IRVVVCDLHDQPEVRANHLRACLLVALLDTGGELDLLIRGEQRNLPDLPKVDLDSCIGIFARLVVHWCCLGLSKGETGLVLKVYVPRRHSGCKGGSIPVVMPMY